MADCTESKEETSPRPPVIMKFDAPEESSENSANDEAEGQSCEENSETASSLSDKSPIKIHSPVLMASKFGNSFGIREFKKSGFLGLTPTILRPSQLGSISANPPSTSLTSFSSTITNNPFKKVTDNSLSNENSPTKSSDDKTLNKKHEDGEDNTNDKNENKKSNDNNDKEKDNNKVEENDDVDEGNDDDDGVDVDAGTDDADDKKTKNDDKKNQDNDSNKSTTPKFLPLISNLKQHDNNLNNTVTSNTTVTGFVFGQNFKERATVANDNEDKNSDELSTDSIDNNDDNIIKNNDCKTSDNGSTELMFTTAATACRTTSRPGITLSQAAQEVEEANRANKRKYSQVTLLTGEEDEKNIIQVNCKLFAFDKTTSGWKERGRGTLRLNDRDDESRLVGRATGTQRLILNTKVWPGMTAELAGPKSLRLTAMDVHGDIRIFIIQAAPKEVDELHDLLMQRIERAKERQPKKLATNV